MVAVFADTLLYVNTDECTSCTACYQPDVCPVGAIYPEEQVPDGAAKSHYNSADPTRAKTTRSSPSSVATCSPTDHRDVRTPSAPIERVCALSAPGPRA